MRVPKQDASNGNGSDKGDVNGGQGGESQLHARNQRGEGVPMLRVSQRTSVGHRWSMQTQTKMSTVQDTDRVNDERTYSSGVASPLW